MKSKIERDGVVIEIRSEFEVDSDGKPVSSTYDENGVDEFVDAVHAVYVYPAGTREYEIEDYRVSEWNTRSWNSGTFKSDDRPSALLTALGVEDFADEFVETLRDDEHAL